jgi:hypothetical protein
MLRSCTIMQASARDESCRRAGQGRVTVECVPPSHLA